MRITIEQTEYNKKNKALIEISDDSDIFEAVEAMCGLLVAYGFHPKSVEDGILTKAEDYEIADNIKE